MGTRFMNTVESPVHDGAKRASVEHQVADTVYTNRIDGLYGRYVDEPGARRLIRQRLNPLSALLRSREIATLLGLPWAKLAAGIVLAGYRKSVQMARMAIGFAAFKDGCTRGDLERGVLPLGQCTGLIDDTPTVAEVMRRIVDQAERSQASLERAFRSEVAVS
jgi:enoyl-[acyl-carrier protein] reductase II